MNGGATRKGRIWAAMLVAGVLVLAWVALHVRLPAPTVASGPTVPRPSVALVDSVAIQGTMLLDPTPLFLPTEFNTSRKDYVPSEPGVAFAGFPAKMTFAESALTLQLPEAASVPKTPAEALAGDPPGAPFLAFGRADLNVQSLAPRGAYVEVTDAGTGHTVFGGPLADAHPPSANSWEPMEFMAAVDAAGLVGPVVLTTHSNVAEVDAYFGRFLADKLMIGQRLAPGFYRVVVGP